VPEHPTVRNGWKAVTPPPHLSGKDRHPLTFLVSTPWDFAIAGAAICDSLGKMWRSIASFVRANPRLSIWFACFAATVCAWSVFFALVCRARLERELLHPSPSLSAALLVFSALLWAVSARNISLLRGGWKGRMAMLILVLAVPAGLFAALLLAFLTPTALASVQEKNGRTVVLGLEPDSWDVIAYALYDSVWAGLALRQRREGGAWFWHYPYRGQMKLGLNAQGRAVLLSPLGFPGPFPDGLSTIPCPPGSPPRCVRRRPKEGEKHVCPGQDPSSQLLVAMCDGLAPNAPR
jgi:hypothetical protein